MYPFERFTERAKKVLTMAQQKAESAGHTYIGTEHLLLGLLGVEEGVAAKALTALGVDCERTREAIDATLSRDPTAGPRQIAPTARVKKVIETAFEEARAVGSGFVGTEHLLFGLLIEGEGVAAQVLANLDE